MSEPLDITEADVTTIKRLIPHRYPFLFLDKVRDIVPNQSAVGIKNVTYNEQWFQGHFPNQPVMPGVNMVEALAQTAGVLAAVSNGLIDKDLKIYFMALDNVKFRRIVGPGDQLELHVEVIKMRRKVWRLQGTAKVGGEVAVEAELTAMIDQGE